MPLNFGRALGAAGIEVEEFGLASSAPRKSWFSSFLSFSSSIEVWSTTVDELASQTSGLNLATPPETPFNPHELADLISNYYQLMSRMRYFSPECIKYPPRDPPIDVPLARSLGLESQVIDLLKVLPYVEGLNNEDEFILGGSFATLGKFVFLSGLEIPIT